MKKLTVAIPTYNRNETLNGSLVRLLPQLNERCQLVILDDNSERPVAETAAEVLSRFPFVTIEIRRNRWNVGLVANVLRCFEACETEWIWVPGDDDHLFPDAIQQILNAFDKYPDAAYFSFLTQDAKESGARNQTLLATGLEGFADKLDLPGLVNFMSCSVWKTETFGKNLASGYQYAYSTGWSFALLLSSLGSAEKVVFSNTAIIETVTTAPAATRWSYRRFIFGWVVLLEIPSSEIIRKALAKKMLGFQSPENITAYLLADAASRPWPGRFLFYDIAVGRLSPYGVHRFGRLRFALYRSLFVAPRVGWRIVRLAIAAANRFGIKKIDIADMEGRGNSM